MASAREQLLENIHGVREAAKLSDLQRLAPLPANSPANRKAELLRRGLYVVAFNSMEDYLKRRVTEHFTNLSSVSSLAFDELPPGLQRAAVVDAIRNGVREASYDKGTEVDIIRAVAGAVASTDNRQQYKIHEFAVLRSGSNVSAEDIKAAIATLHIADAWGQMQKLVDSVGNVGTPIRARFETCLLKRNSAAHAGQPIEYSDLIEIADLAVPLCFAFDAIFSAGMSRLADNVPTGAKDPKIDLASQMEIRFVARRARGWCRLDQNKQPFRYYPNRQQAVQHSLTRLSDGGTVVVLGSVGEITGWHLRDHRHPHP